MKRRTTATFIGSGVEENMEQIKEADKDVALQEMRKFFNEFKQAVYKKIKQIKDLDRFIAPDSIEKINYQS
jgi:hypothetical protein